MVHVVRFGRYARGQTDGTHTDMLIAILRHRSHGQSKKIERTEQLWYFETKPDHMLVVLVGCQLLFDILMCL